MVKKSSRTLWTAKLSGKAVSKGKRLDYTLKRIPYQGYVLGMDTSLRSTGVALIAFQPPQPPKLLLSHTLKLSGRLQLAVCLGTIARTVLKILDCEKVDHVVLEQTIYVQNVRTAQILGAARGAAISAVALRGVRLSEYPPLRVKQAVVGFGRASKEQVIGMVQHLLGLTTSLPTDEADAAALAFCHAFTSREVKEG